ncbi:NAD-dependent epimerase/dehydratase family protein [Euzebya sp.]|uniref:NAD-dependent epimerase/dehydratase family protein n=1 Tax=Euzebya sp. TaxID=1971409 RepID=UPI0035131431
MRRILVTGSAGHLGEGLVRVLRERGDEVVGLDLLASGHTDVVGSITDVDLVRDAVAGVDAVIHTATLHKPHVATHSRQDFVDTNVTGTLTLLEAAVAAGVGAFVLTSTTSAFGRALSPGPDQPAAWITEDVEGVPKNVYGVTKTAAEDLGELVHRDHGLPVVVLRTSRFFPEADDDPAVRSRFDDDNLKAVEYLHRRVALEDVVDAHLLAVERAADLGFDRFVISATTPFTRVDAPALRHDLAGVLDRRLPAWRAAFDQLGWTLPAGLDRVYDNARARAQLGWSPRWDVGAILDRAAAGDGVRTPLSQVVGAKGYHPGGLVDGMYRTG